MSVDVNDDDARQPLRLQPAHHDHHVVEGAEAELNKAIQIRGPLEENGWLYYEFNRVVCRMMQDEEFEQGKAPSTEVRDRILADLHAAAQSELKDLIPMFAEIKNWMSLNKLTLRDLR